MNIMADPDIYFREEIHGNIYSEIGKWVNTFGGLLHPVRTQSYFRSKFDWHDLSQPIFNPIQWSTSITHIFIHIYLCLHFAQREVEL